MNTTIAFRFDANQCFVSPYKYNYDFKLMKHMLELNESILIKNNVNYDTYQLMDLQINDKKYVLIIENMDAGISLVDYYDDKKSAIYEIYNYTGHLHLSEYVTFLLIDLEKLTDFKDNVPGRVDHFECFVVNGTNIKLQ